MALLIDGYNLLYEAGILSRGIGPGSLERARRALLNFLAAVLDEPERARTTVVFDAKQPPPDVPDAFQVQGIAVRFAADYEEADELIEELIRRESAPKQLTVVSSDRRIRRAAGRRRATSMASGPWYEQMSDRRAAESPPPRRGKPAQPLTEDEVQRWLEIFGEVSVEPLAADDPHAAPHSEPLKPSEPDLPETETEKPWNPFPPGYGEDLLQ